MTSSSSLTTSTSMSGLLPSTGHVVTVIGSYDDPGCSSISETYIIKTTAEEDMRPGMLVQCVFGSACNCESIYTCIIHLFMCES